MCEFKTWFQIWGQVLSEKSHQRFVFFRFTVWFFSLHVQAHILSHGQFVIPMWRHMAFCIAYGQDVAHATMQCVGSRLWGVCVQSLHIVGIAASDHAVTCNVSFILLTQALASQWLSHKLLQHRGDASVPVSAFTDVSNAGVYHRCIGCDARCMRAASS